MTDETNKRFIWHGCDTSYLAFQFPKDFELSRDTVLLGNATSS